MDPVWLKRNIVTSWRRRADFGNFIRDLAWVYGPKLGLAGKELTIAFRYPDPIGGIRLRVRVNHGADAFIYGEVFDQRYYCLPLKAAPATILDLGANIGLTAIYFGRRYPHAEIACVEPFPGNTQLLAQNLRINAVNSEVFPAAIDVEDGRAFLELDIKDYGHRLAQPDATSGKAPLEVTAVSIPSLLKKLGWDRIGLMKVDIEGHEKILLKRQCDWLEKVDALCIEWHDELSEGKRQLTAIADQFGFMPPQLFPGAMWFLSRP